MGERELSDGSSMTGLVPASGPMKCEEMWKNHGFARNSKETDLEIFAVYVK